MTQFSHTFKVWAPLKNNIILQAVSPKDQRIPMKKDQEGYFSAELEVEEDFRYFYEPDNEGRYPDPASHYQPEGVHGPSAVVNHSQFNWTDQQWRNIPFRDLILYELHVGTFTPEGTFEAIIPRLKDLAETGVNAIELLPVSQFPGNRNWGYDGVYLYAVQNSYGGPEGLKRLIDACHQHGIAVYLDLVFNHLGPEGNYLSNFGPYFTSSYCTPWGDAINFDSEWSDGVREFFSENALHWFRNYHIDGLRLDAIHMVFDNGATHFWELTSNKVRLLEQEIGRPLYLIAESDLNSPKVIKTPDLGGYGFDAQWLDDFHHSLYVLLDDKGKSRYADFGRMEQLGKAYTDGFVHSGEFVEFRKRRHGASSAGIAGDRFVVFNQNHDQVGNRVMGERLCMLVDFERVKLAAAAILLSPYVPMLFMGEEYADENPFFYFVSHSDEELIKAVQEGRKEEFKAYNNGIEPPDPQAEKTFEDSVLSWEKRKTGKHQVMLNWHKELICLRKNNPALLSFNKNDIRANVLGPEVLVLNRQTTDGKYQLYIVFNFSEDEASCVMPSKVQKWTKILDSKDQQWQTGVSGLEKSLAPKEALPDVSIQVNPCSVVVYEAEV